MSDFSRAARVLTVLGAFVVASARSHAAAFRFEDVTRAAGIDYVNTSGAAPAEKRWITETIGQGAAWGDYDGDGKLDLFVVNGSDYARWPKSAPPNRLYRGDGRGGFTDVTEASGVAGKVGWGFGAAAADYDNDGDTDIYVSHYGADRLYRNEGRGVFTEVAAKAGVSDESWSTSAAWFDLESDGDLDLYVANYMACDPKVVPAKGTPGAQAALCTFRGLEVVCGPLKQVPQQDAVYRNNGDGSFTDVTRAAGFFQETPRFGLGVVTGDYDNDGDVDLYVANDSVPNNLWRNDGKGKFSDQGMLSLVALNADGRAQAGMGTDFGDYNGDGWLDIVVTNFSHDLNTIYTNQGGKFFSDDSVMVGLGVTQMRLSWGTGFHDFDRDGDLDLFVANGHTYPEVDAVDIGTTFRQPNDLFENRGERFVQVTREAGPGFAVERSFRGAAFADHDDDGDVDVFVVALGEPALLLRNDTPASGHWLRVRLVGKTSNRDGIGARVTVEAAGKRQIGERKGGGSYLSTNDPRLHFGLGTAQRVERLEVRWPSGRRDVLRDVEADRTITVTEGAHAAP